MGQFVQEPGIYRAYPTAWAVEKTEGGAVQFAVQFSLSDVKQGGEWHALQEPEEITGYFYVVKKDGTLNDRTIKSIKEALGWDGASLASLADGDWSETQVQVTVGAETYNGKERLKVQWLNHRDYQGGGVGTTDPQLIRSLDAQYGSMLRAIAGPAAATKPSPNGTAGKPADRVAEIRQRLFKAFQDTHSHLSLDEQKGEFRKLVTDAIPGVDVRAMTFEQWQTVETAMSVLVPAGGDDEFAESDIPF